MQVNRVSHEGEYEVDDSNRPLNPWGRTGLRGRGMLGRSINMTKSKNIFKKLS